MNESFDIAVVGSGAAGIAAAVAAARAGGKTILLDRHSGPGGTGGLSGLTTLCGLFDHQGHFLNEGFAREFAEAIAETGPLAMGKVWVLPYRPEKFRNVASDLLAATPGLHTCWHTPLAKVILDAGRIVELNDFRVGAVVDCTGSAEIARMAGVKCLMTDESTQAPAVVFPLGNVERKFHSPADVAQVVLPLMRAGWPPLSFQPSLEPGTLTVKFAGVPGQVGPVIEFLRAHVAGFENCSTSQTTFLRTQRAGRMIIGRHLLTGGEVLAGQRFPDAVARGAWPVEQWGVDGLSQFRYLPPGLHYEIPARSLCAATVENLFMGGKTVSADVDAMASLRVMGCCLATGAAAGELAARCLEAAHAT